MKTIINFILDLLGINRRTKKEKQLDSEKEALEDKLRDIDKEQLDKDDLVKYLNDEDVKNEK